MHSNAIDSIFSPELPSAAREARFNVSRAFSSLPRVTRQVVRLRASGSAFRQIGLELGMTEATARSLFSRARTAVCRRVLTEEPTPNAKQWHAGQ